MVHYRRNRIPGGTYAFTVTLRDRRSDLLVHTTDALRNALQAVRRSRPFIIHAAVVLPDHAHFIWELPPGDADYSTRWQLIKAAFNRRAAMSQSPWQSRFWEHTIRDDSDFSRHVDYIHFNPVKHGYVPRAAEWPHSTIHQWIRAGRIPYDWGIANKPEFDFGER